MKISRIFNLGFIYLSIHLAMAQTNFEADFTQVNTLF